MKSANPDNLLTRQFMLPPDVKILPVSELAEHVRAEIGGAEGDFTVTRPGFRSFSRVVDANTVSLLEEFRSPVPIPEAIARFALRRSLDPETVLESAFPILQNFTASLLLVPKDSAFAEGVEARLAPGQTIGGFEILRLVQVLEDTEIYLATSSDAEAVALKVARSESLQIVRPMLDREAAILKLLDGTCSPRLVAKQLTGNRPFLAIEWLPGVSLNRRAHELRNSSEPNWRERLHRLCRNVIATYQVLHQHRVVHGDVHSGNLLVDGDDNVRVIDFGLSRLLQPGSALNHGQRAGFSWNMEPEAARQVLQIGVAPAATFAGEQYSVASLVYTTICGEHYLKAPPEREAMLRQVIESQPLPFSRRGFESWPATEKVLRRALSKSPAERYASIEELGGAFSAATPPQTPNATIADSGPGARPLETVLSSVATWDAADLDAVFPVAPQNSVQYGTSGLAFFLYRVSLIRDDPRLLAAADMWSRRSLSTLTSPQAFEAADVGVTAERVGPGSIFHRAPGVHLVQGLISQARGDIYGLAEQAEQLAPFIYQQDQSAEVAFGLSGLLLAGSLLLEVAGTTSRADLRALQEALGLAADRLWRRQSQDRSLHHLGTAHGLAGVLYAQLRVRQLLELPIPDTLSEKLDWLAGQAEPEGRGASWPGTAPHPGQSEQTPAHSPGWCAGTAGHVHLWTLAHGTLGHDHYLRRAEQAAWHCWEHPDDHGHLCCGLSGRAYALLRLYQYTGESQWLHRARRLIDRAQPWLETALRDGDRPYSLYWGALGPLLAAVEVSEPELAAMPVFASQGWV